MVRIKRGFQRFFFRYCWQDIMAVCALLFIIIVFLTILVGAMSAENTNQSTLDEPASVYTRGNTERSNQ